MSQHAEIEPGQRRRMEPDGDAATTLPRMTYAEFLVWADEDTLAEWVNGEVIMASPASRRHQDIVNFLLDLIKGFARLQDLGKVLDGPFQMKIADSGREPDVLFVAREHLGRLLPTYLDGPADLAVEVVSPESGGRDRGDKFYEYRAAGIPEYWLIDPQLEQAEFYQLDAEGRYQTVAPDADGIYHSRALPGYWLRVAWLWQDPPPDMEEALLEIAPEVYGRYLRERLRKAGQ